MSFTIENPRSPYQAVGNNAFLPFGMEQRNRVAVAFSVVFLTVVGALKLNQFLFFDFDTSPAVVLVPVGIALAAVYLGGYRMSVPLFCAWFLATLTSPSHPPILVIISAAIAYPLQAVIGAYFLKRFNFLGTLGRTRCALVLIAVALALPLVAPSITTAVQWMSGSLPASVWTTWSRSWAGGVLSIMIFTPLITTWYRHQARQVSREFMESAAATLSLVVVIYFTFWTEFSQEMTFFLLYLLFGILFWIGLRMPPRHITLAIFLTTVLGMAGTIMVHPGPNPLDLQLLFDELFIVLVAPAFYILSSLVEERRQVGEEVVLRALDLEEANRKLSLEDQAKNMFLAMLAHELRNPLAPVISSLELMKIKLTGLERPDLMQLIEVAQSHSTTVTLLLDDLLDISRISQKKFKLQKESIELRVLIGQTERTFGVLHKHRNHTLSISMPDESTWIEADPLRLEQIIVNLLNNAAKYTPTGGQIQLSVIRDKGKHFRINVKDNGIGIERQMLSKVFEKFIQMDDNNSGLGIGLWLTKRLVELHGGKVWVESEGLGKGANFIVLLPDAESVQLPLASSPRRHRKGSASAPKTMPLQAFNILVVDDNEAAAYGLSKLLELKGHTVSVAHGGSAALEMAGNVRPEVVLLDIGLPGMDGYEVARRLRQAYTDPSLVLVALTGYGQEEDKENARKAGFNYHLTKPVGIADVEAVLARDTAPFP